MSHSETLTTGPMAKLARNPFIIALVCGIALTGCAKKNKLDSTDDLGLNTQNSPATPGSQQDFTVNVGDRIFFDTDSTSIRADAQQTLRKQAQWLNQYSSYRIVIEGHADERGTREYNLALGARRGSVVVNYLVSKGVNGQRITTQSFGKERPVAICNDISCWSQNRRAVTVLGGAGM